MRRHVAVVRNDVAKDRIAYMIRVIRIGELGTTLASDAALRNVGSYKSHTA
jgi:hypothetical protein